MKQANWTALSVRGFRVCPKVRRVCPNPQKEMTLIVSDSWLQEARACDRIVLARGQDRGL